MTDSLLPMYASVERHFLVAYASAVERMNKLQISTERKNLLDQISGDAFFRFNDWNNQRMKRIFFKKPMSDKEVFQVTLFLMGNGCPRELLYQWILSSYYWSKRDLGKRWRQLEWILKNCVVNQNEWYYYDIILRQYYFLSGNIRHAYE